MGSCNKSASPAASATADSPALDASVSAATPESVQATASEASNPKVKWLTIEQAAERMKKEPRKVFIDVYTDWCGWCKKMDKDTFSDPKVAALINKHFYAVKLDAEGKTPITLDGHTYTFKPAYKSHELAVALLQGQMSYPTTVYLDEKMNMITPVPGYMNAKSFSQVLRYIGEEHHKNMTWQEFEKMAK
ncbi:hypothetical protein GCM10028895_09970 [Pontibacter rugosus]